MEVYRISKLSYSQKLKSSGRENRWNKDREFVIYTGSSRSLATLELIVHRNTIKPQKGYQVAVISIADNDYLYKQIQLKDLPVNWRSFTAYPEIQKIGSNWYVSQETLVLKVPSAVIPYEYNYILNTKHPDFDRNVSLVRNEDYFWDLRLV